MKKFRLALFAAAAVFVAIPLAWAAFQWKANDTGGVCLDILAGTTNTQAWCFQSDSDMVIDDGSGDTPTMTWTDGTDETTVLTKVDGSHTTMTITAADAFQILTGNLRVGNGTPGETHNGEDLYVEGISEFDGSAFFDGAVDLGSTLALGGYVDLTAVASADAAATNDSLEVAWSSPVDTTGTNTHNAMTVDLAIGNATGGTNAVRGVQIDAITGDAQVTETAINVETGWDVGLAVASPADYTYVQGIDAAATGDSLEIAFTSPVDTTGTNTHNALTIDLAIGNATGGTNVVTGVQIDAITGDAQVTEYGINIGTGFDTAIQSGGNVVLDDGTTDSPSLTFQDATNETVVIAKTDAGDLTITTDASDGVTVLTGDLRVGNGVAGTAAMNGEDLYVEGESEFDGAMEVDGALNVDGAADFDNTVSLDGAVTVTADVAVTVGDGANGDLKELTGLWRVRDWSVGASVNGTSQQVTTDLMPDTTEDANWTATTNMTVAESTTLERVGSSALQITVGASPADGNGADNTLTSGNQDWSADESVGLWMRCSLTTASGDWVLEITDSVAGATEVAIPALATANTWTWLEINIGGVADASKDVITTIGLDLSAAGATAFAAGGTCLFDFMVKWDGASEEALSQDVLEGSIPTALAMVTGTGGNRIPVVIVEHTDYFIHYETGNDFFVALTDQSANSVWGRAAIE